VFATVHAYGNDERVFPGLSAELVHLPVPIADGVVPHLSARLAGWLQPDDQRFDARGGAAGGLASIRVAVPIGGVAPYVDVQVKSAGWVAGEPRLDAATSARIGVALPLFR
jgi:hypothetical protein